MIVFRADISTCSGLSHLRRCAYLASLLKKNNKVLVCSRRDKKTVKFLSERNIPATFIEDPVAVDLAEMEAIIFDLDSFSSADSVLLEKAKKAGVKTIQVLGTGDSSRPADIHAGAPAALLHHKFRHFNMVKRKYRKKIGNIFINLGDLLPYRDLRAIVDVLHRLRYRMKIAPGLGLKKADKRNLMRIYPGIHFCGRSESPARAYFEADLALIPPGEEALEAACVGTPALFMPLAKGQDPLVETCTGLGTGVRIPSLADFSVQTVRDAITPLTLERREQMGAAGKKLVDGLGVQRFFKVLKEQGIIT
jgi:spore coat polysaccharide biosynthesis predicted glycosyltransferase SpsG